MKHVLLSLLIVSPIFSEIVYEQGSLSSFITGQSPGTSYENWISHVTEGIASPGYNDYGPDFLDIQTNGLLESWMPTTGVIDTLSLNTLLRPDTTTLYIVSVKDGNCVNKDSNK